MRRILFLGLLLPLLSSCKHGQATSRDGPESTAKSTQRSKWSPIVKGFSYQLSLKDGLFGFCDDRGPHQISVATGEQTAGTQTCKARSPESPGGDNQERCDDKVMVSGDPDAGDDNIVLVNHSFLLTGHVHTCDRDGTMFVIATGSGVDVIDDTTGKVSSITSGGPPAVIGSGWVAWATADKENGLRLATVASVMKTAVVPADGHIKHF